MAITAEVQRRRSGGKGETKTGQQTDPGEQLDIRVGDAQGKERATQSSNQQGDQAVPQGYTQDSMYWEIGRRSFSTALCSRSATASRLMRSREAV